jgi:vacuolar-type H+-ATPase subunit E/Vma4
VALPELLDALRAQAAARRADELARADSEAERIRADSRASQDARKAEHVERVVHDANEAARRSLAEARSEAAASTLQARGRLLGRVRAALEQRIRSTVADPDYRAEVADELGGALERIPPGKVIVRTTPELAEALTRAVRGTEELVLEVVPDFGTGFLAASPDTGVEIDGTLETKLLHRWPQIAVTVLAELGR